MTENFAYQLFAASCPEEVEMCMKLSGYTFYDILVNRHLPIALVPYYDFTAVISKFGLTWFSDAYGRRVQVPDVFDRDFDLRNYIFDSAFFDMEELNGFPKKFENDMNISWSALRSFKNGPTEVGRAVYINYCDNLTSLEDAPRCETILANYCPNLVHVDFPSVRKCSELHLIGSHSVDKDEIVNLSRAGVDVYCQMF